MAVPWTAHTIFPHRRLSLTLSGFYPQSAPNFGLTAVRHFSKRLKYTWSPFKLWEQGCIPWRVWSSGLCPQAAQQPNSLERMEIGRQNCGCVAHGYLMRSICSQTQACVRYKNATGPEWHLRCVQVAMCAAVVLRQSLCSVKWDRQNRLLLDAQRAWTISEICSALYSALQINPVSQTSLLLQWVALNQIGLNRLQLWRRWPST